MIIAASAMLAAFGLVVLAVRSGTTNDIFTPHERPLPSDGRTFRVPSGPTSPAITWTLTVSTPPTDVWRASIAGPLTVVWLVVGLAGLVLASYVGLLVVHIVGGRSRGQETNKAPVAATDDLRVAAARRVQEVTDQGIARLERSDVGEVITDCWARLQRVSVDLGVPPNPTDTATDFTERMLSSLAVDDAALSRLADLYREARFSSHRMSASQRRAARDALAAIRESVRMNRATRS